MNTNVLTTVENKIFKEYSSSPSVGPSLLIRDQVLSSKTLSGEVD